MESIQKILSEQSSAAVEALLGSLVDVFSNPTKNVSAVEVGRLSLAAGQALIGLGMRNELPTLAALIVAQCATTGIQAPSCVDAWIGGENVAPKPALAPVVASPAPRPVIVLSKPVEAKPPVEESPTPSMPTPAPAAQPKPQVVPAAPPQAHEVRGGAVRNDTMAEKLGAALADPKETLGRFYRLMNAEGNVKTYRNPTYTEAMKKVVRLMLEGNLFDQSRLNTFIQKLRSTMFDYMIFMDAKDYETFAKSCPTETLRSFVFDGDDSLQSLVSQIAETSEEEVARKAVFLAYKLSFAIACCQALGKEDKLARQLKGRCGQILDKMISQGLLSSEHPITKKRSGENGGLHVPDSKMANLGQEDNRPHKLSAAEMKAAATSNASDTTPAPMSKPNGIPAPPVEMPVSAVTSQAGEVAAAPAV